MTISELLDAAKRAQGSLGNVAAKLGTDQSNLSNWRKGRYKPSATQIARLADMASLPVFETVAEVEAQLEGDEDHVWARALGKLRAAGVAATVILTLATCLTPNREARAAGLNGSESTLSAKITKSPASITLAGLLF